MANPSKKIDDSPLPYIGTYLPIGSSDADANSHNVNLDAEAPDESMGSLTMCDYEGYSGGISDRVFEWVNSHNHGDRPLITRVSKAVTFVPFDTFKQDLLASYDDMKTQLIARYTPRASGPFNFRDDAIVLVEGQKSNKWVAEIVLKERGDVPFAYVRLGEKDAREFVKFLESLDQIKGHRHAQIKAQFNDKTIVLFDDGSYSGKQLEDHLKAICNANTKFNLQMNCIAVIIPNMTRYAVGVVQNFIQTNPSLPILIARHNLIPTLHSLTEPAQGLVGAQLAQAQQAALNERTKLATMWFKGDTTLTEKVGLIWGWAGHKVPNDVSFLEPIANGAVFDAQGNSIVNPKGKPFGYKLIPDNTPCYKAVRADLQKPLYNFFKVPGLGKTLYRGALPTLEGMNQLAQMGINVMVNLREKEYTADEQAFLKDKKIKVVHIPFDYDKPEIKQVVQFVTEYFKARKKEERVFVHCRHGADRTGVMVAAVKLALGTTLAQAKQEMLDPKYGFHRLTHPNLVSFVENLKGQEIQDEAFENVKKFEEQSKRDSGIGDEVGSALGLGSN